MVTSATAPPSCRCSGSASTCSRSIPCSWRTIQATAPGAAQVQPEQLDEILGGLMARGVLARCAAVLSSYLGDPGVADVVAVRSRRSVPRALERRTAAIP